PVAAADSGSSGAAYVAAPASRMPATTVPKRDSVFRLPRHGLHGSGNGFHTNDVLVSRSSNVCSRHQLARPSGVRRGGKFTGPSHRGWQNLWNLLGGWHSFHGCRLRLTTPGSSPDCGPFLGAHCRHSAIFEPGSNSYGFAYGPGNSPIR